MYPPKSADLWEERRQRQAQLPQMPEIDQLLFHQLSMIDKIIRDETWLEGERRGCSVPPSDPAVRENVCRVILRVGAQVRETAAQSVARGVVGEAARSFSHVRHKAA
jgi:hypothetical protein